MIDWINRINTTPIRILISIGLAVQFVLSLQWATEHNDWTPTGTQITILYIITGIILTMMGFDVAQWVFKRHTDIDYQNAKNAAPPQVAVGGPATVNADTATVTATPIAPVDARSAIDLAAHTLPAGRTGELTRDD